MERKELVVKPESLLLSGDRCFFTVQGEGDSFGKPAIFLRLHLCNLQCTFCDTPYTWDRSDKRFFEEPERWSLEATKERVSSHPCKRLVITGGEPLLQRKPLIKLINSFDDDWVFEIESNGTLPPIDKKKINGREIQYNLSPKLSNSGNPEKVRYRPQILKQYLDGENVFFKFVVVEREDIDEIQAIVKECEIPDDRVIIMPEGITQEAVAEHGRLVAGLCKEKGWRLVPRLHIMLWGNERNK